MFHDPQALLHFLQTGIKACKVLVLGDVMLDRYYYGEVKRISPEAPVPVAKIHSEQDTLGGAANVALNLFNLGCTVALVGVVGCDDSRSRMEKLMQELPMATTGLVTASRPTTTKLRVIGGHQQMLRLDFEQAEGLSKRTEREVRQRLEALLDAGIDSMIISDYAKGVCTPALCRYLISEARRRSIPLIVDPKGSNWKKYTGAPFITPNVKELAEAIHASVANENGPIEKAVVKVRKRFSIDHMILTRSERGMSVMSYEQSLHIPTLAQDVFDVSGAGDTVIAVMGAALAGGLAVVEASLLANAAAGYVVGKVGTYAIHNQELQDEVVKKSGEPIPDQEREKS